MGRIAARAHQKSGIAKIERMPFPRRSFLLLCLGSRTLLAADDAQPLLNRTAKLYSDIVTFQVESLAERQSAENKITVALAVYFRRPNMLRIETKDKDNVLRSLLISAGETVTEYRAWRNEYIHFAGAGTVSFSPERGTGLGEMLYDTIADGVNAASVRGKQVLSIRGEQIRCTVVDADYKQSDGLTRFAFWLSEDRGLVLRRAVTFWDGNEVRTLVSSVQALTINEKLPDTFFEFEPPPGAKRVLE